MMELKWGKHFITTCFIFAAVIDNGTTLKDVSNVTKSSMSVEQLSANHQLVLDGGHPNVVTEKSNTTIPVNEKLRSSTIPLVGVNLTVTTTPSIDANSPTKKDKSSHFNTITSHDVNLSSSNRVYRKRKYSTLQKVSKSIEENEIDFPLESYSDNDIDTYSKQWKRDKSLLKSEIINSKSNPSKFMEILRKAQIFKRFEDPFSVSKRFQNHSIDKNEGIRSKIEENSNVSEIIWTTTHLDNHSSAHVTATTEQSVDSKSKNSDDLDIESSDYSVTQTVYNYLQAFFVGEFLSTTTEPNKITAESPKKNDTLNPIKSKNDSINQNEIKETHHSSIFTADDEKNHSFTIFHQDNKSIDTTPNGDHVSDPVPIEEHTPDPISIEEQSSDPISIEEQSSDPISIEEQSSDPISIEEQSSDLISTEEQSSDQIYIEEHTPDPISIDSIEEHTPDPISIDSIEEHNSEPIPIYQEISGTLHIDSSIDDIHENELLNKFTEPSDEFISKFNSSHLNLLEPNLSNLLSSNDNDNQEKKVQLSNEAGNFDSNVIFYHENNTKFSQNEPHLAYLQSFDNSMRNSSTFPNFNSGSTILRTRTHDSEKTDPGNRYDPQRQETPNIREVSDGSYYSLIGYDSGAGHSRKTKKKTRRPVIVGNHNERVLKAQALRMLQVMNRSVDPCEDFYEYSCGKWPEVFPLEDKALDNTFDRLREGLDEVLKFLLEEPPLKLDSEAVKAAKTLYRGCMNEELNVIPERIEERDTSPLKDLLRQLGGWPVLEGDAWNETAFDWVRLMATLRTYNNDILLSEWVAADITNSSNHIIQLDQPALGLPGREYYISMGDQTYRMAYMDLMVKSCQILGGAEKTCAEEMSQVLHFETQLAKILIPAEERRNLSSVHQRITLQRLQEEIVMINWMDYFSLITGGGKPPDEVIVFAMKYMKRLETLIASTKKRTVSNYLLWRFVKNRISNLGRKLLAVKQEFIQVLFGSKAQPERWLSCVNYVNGNLGYVTGALFVKQYYPQSSKDDSHEMVRLIQESFIEAIEEASWMAKTTRQMAVKKVLAMVQNVGYPEYILDDEFMDSVYGDLKFNESEHFWNVIEMLKFHWRMTHDLLKKRVNRTEWTTTPAVVNAYYSRSKNMIMFPAGILQPPFYHPAFPKALNFGGIGVVVGHEISHGFDDRGRQFDQNGNLQQWWTEDDISFFYDRATCMLDQYGEFSVSSLGLNVNAVNTLGENIADNAGLAIAYRAYQRWKDSKGPETASVPNVNLTYDQLFFVNFGQIWCEVNSPEAMLTKIRGGQHSPNKYRVIGTVSNSEEFLKAFGCPKRSKMSREEKCQIW